MNTILFENATLIDPSQSMAKVARLLVRNGLVAAIDAGDGDVPEDCQRRDLRGMLIAPGLVDIGTELGEPGREEDETIESGLQAALSGGFTSIVCSANTLPPIDAILRAFMCLDASAKNAKVMNLPRLDRCSKLVHVASATHLHRLKIRHY
jgi:dihydroorotase-like cyclic amidohydrolase